MSVLSDLSDAGVSIWLDDLSRSRLSSGDLQQLIDDKSVVGVTTNPSIFQKALSDGAAYDEQVRDLALRGCDIGEAVRALTTYDVRWACDVLKPVYDRTDGIDGRVSIEVDPRIAHDSDRTVAEAKALWWLVDRPNLYIKIPATQDGLPAITKTLAEGISVNVTLIFSLERYDAVMEAFLAGMEAAKDNGHDLSRMGSVASFFVSRVDTEIDKRLEKSGAAADLRGKAAIANARLAYQHYEKVFAGDRWKALEQAGAKPQRPLWASTGVKDPAYDDTQYVVELVAPGTVNTMPEATLDAVADHGTARGDTITSTYADAQKVLDDLKTAGIDYDDVVQQLEVEAVQKFEDAWNELIESVTANLEKAGADVSGDGSSSPAGDGPAAADREGSA
ncbi:MAG: transaldolase [Actinobacteria bacterium]|nr:transaldolase [Actinomycetota bacterium]MCA1720455.1 transaldolase [Actinomycetota bacterium]